MKKVHKVLSGVLLLTTIVITFVLDMKITDTAAKSLVTFFSVVFGFYITSIAILYNSSYIKVLHEIVDQELKMRGTQILKSYILTSGYWSIFSISAIIVYTTYASPGDGTSILRTNITPFDIPFTESQVNMNNLISSMLFGISVLNIFYMLLIMHTILDGMVEEGKR